MFVDLGWLSSAPLPPFVIIGSGPAGLSLALELERLGKPSIVLEAGGMEYSEESQDHYVGRVVGDPYYDLSSARLRMFGGSSNHWGGWSRQLDKHDFEARPDFPNTGWPIDADELHAFLPAAQRVLELPTTGNRHFTEEVDEIEISIKSTVHFNVKYQAHISNSKLVHVALDTAVTDLKAVAGRIVSVKVRNNEQDAEIPVQNVILACGGIENSRLLLWSNVTSPEPVVAQAETLGRYWMEHPTFTVGVASLGSKLRDKLDKAGVLFFAPKASALEKYGLLNANIRLVGRGPENGFHRAACKAANADIVAFGDTADEFGCNAEVGISWEQLPSRDNRIELGDEKDRFGVPRPVLYWKKHDIDYVTVKKALELFGKALVDADLGYVRAADYVRWQRGFPSNGELAGNHHMGGTRMASSASEGVVDKDLKVFGMQNLFVAGSSVFPTVGHANPTLTIVQLSIRLAERLAGRHE